MDSESLKELFWCINTLTSKDTTDDASSSGVRLDSLLQQKLHVVQTYVDASRHIKTLLKKAAPCLFDPPQDDNARLRYLEYCLALLTTLAELLTAHSKLKSEPNVLSIAQQQSVRNLLQFVVGFGVQPNLLPGVGIPPKARLGGSQTRFSDKIWTACRSHRVLVMTVKSLLNCAEVVPLWDLVVHKHLVDILAALMQLCHAPIKKVAAGDTESSGAESHFHLPFLMTRCREADACDAALVAEMHADRRALSAHLNRLVEGTYQPLLVRDLLLLMSCPMLLGKGDSEGTQARKLPKWLKTTCGRILSRCLLKKDGLSKVILGVFDAWSMSEYEESPGEHDWMKCDAFARTVANVPSIEGMTAETYYEKMSPQVLELLQKTTTDGASDKRLGRVARGIADAMLDVHPRLTARLIFRRMFDPLLRCMLLDGVQPEPSGEVPSEADLCGCIELVHKLSCNTGPSRSLQDALVPLLPVLYDILVSIQGSVSYLKSPCEDTLAATLASQDPSFATSVLCWCVFRNEPLLQCGSVRRDVCFLLGDSGGVRACSGTSPLSEDDWLVHVDNVCLGLASILGRPDCRDVCIKFFLSLLKKLNAALKQDPSSVVDESSALLETELRSAELRRNLLLLHLVQSLAEVAAGDLPQNREAVVDFIVETLGRGVRPQEESEESPLVSQSVLLGLTMLGVLVAEADMDSSADISSLQKCLPNLDILAKQHYDSEIKRAARSLQVAIATHGVVGTSRSGAAVGRSGVACGPETEVVDRLRLEKIAEMVCGYGLLVLVDKAADALETLPSSRQETEEPKVRQEMDADASLPQKTAFEEVWSQLHNPMIPVRGHAFIELRNLVERRDAETSKNWDRVMEACRAGIREEDSYVYLTAIGALAALADWDTDATLRSVADDLASEGVVVEARLNLGEVLLRTCKNLGEMAPKYRNLLVNCFLSSAKDKDPVVRASGVSNLGELCGKLGYSFLPITQEVLGCLRSLTTTDPDVLVRRAAILALASLIKGMGTQLFKIIPEELKGLHRELRRAYSETMDDVARLQAQLAIEELDRVTKEFLTPQQPLQKTIHVLDFPQ